MPSLFFEIRLRAAAVVPPIVLPVPPMIAMPTSLLPLPLTPSGSRPMVLPWIRWPVTPAPTMLMPSSALLVMTLRSLAPVPPMIALEPAMSMPSSPLPTPVEPVPVVPIQLPAMLMLSAPDWIAMPSRVKRVIIRPRIVLPSEVLLSVRPSTPAPAEKPSIRTTGVLAA